MQNTKEIEIKTIKSVMGYSTGVDMFIQGKKGSVILSMRQWRSGTCDFYVTIDVLDTEVKISAEDYRNCLTEAIKEDMIDKIHIIKK